MKILSTYFTILLLTAGISMGEQDLRVMNLRIVWSQDPQHQAVAVWDGETENNTAVVLYDTVSHAKKTGQYAFSTALSASGLYQEKSTAKGKKEPSASPDLYFHHAVLKDLKPETVYYLAIKSADGVSREYHFRTAPCVETPFKIIYAGDSRSRIDMARQISVQISDMIETDDSISALLHGGDYAVQPRRDVWKDWLEAYSLTTTDEGKLLPIIPVVGNHDVGGKSPIFRQAYGFPGEDDNYYVCHMTPSVGILCLNTEISAEGDQKIFLENALAELEKNKVKWRIAAYHRPAYPAVKQPGAAKVSWVPLFEQYNIDLVLESDGHCIKRTVPIRDGQESSDGVVYLGEGGYGAPQRDPIPDRWYLEGDQAFASKGDHVMMLEIGPKTINYSTILVSGEVVDSASFKPRR